MDPPLQNDGVIVDKNNVLQLIKHMATGAAPGPSGRTAELLLVLLDDEVCSAAIHALVGDICNGRLSPASREWLLSSRLLAVPKSSGSNAVRPIAIGEVLYRVASAYLASLISPHLRQLFPCIQKGVGVNGGADRARHAVQLSLELLKQRCDPVILSIDIKNAFNEIDRAAIGRAILAAPSLHKLWRFFKWSYGPLGRCKGSNKEILLHPYFCYHCSTALSKFHHQLAQHYCHRILR